MKIENIVFIDAVKLLAQKMNVSLPEKEKSEQEKIREREMSKLYQVNELARDFFFACLTKTSYGKQAREYLDYRGVTENMINDFHLGFAPPAWDKLSLAFAERNIEPEILIKAGLVAPRPSGDGIYDRFRDRIMFPICDARGKVVGFGGRVLNDSQPKYLNSPETIVFNKRNILYGLDAAIRYIRESGQVIVVEGYMDAITAHAFGVKNVVASLGTAFTPEHAKPLLRYGAEIIFAYDSDAAGQNATLRALSVVRVLGAKVRVVSVPDGKDPDEYIRKHGADAFRALVKDALPFLDYQMNKALENTDYSTLEGKVAVVAKAIPTLGSSDNAVEVNAHITRLSQTLSIDEGAIRSELRKFMALAKKDKNVSIGKNISASTVSKKVTSAVTQAEQHIIRMACEDYALIPYIQVQLSVEDIEDEYHREIMNSIFNAYNMGKNVAPASVAMDLSETANTELAHIMLIDTPCADVSRMADDCIKIIQLSRLKRLYEEHRLRADELERMGDSRFLQELSESQRIKNEIDKLHHA